MLAAWKWVYDCVPEAGESRTAVLSYCGIIAAFAGGIASLKRGKSGERYGLQFGLLVLALGMSIAAVAFPKVMGLILTQFGLLQMVGVWQFALLGGLTFLAITWALLAFGQTQRKSPPS